MARIIFFFPGSNQAKKNILHSDTKISYNFGIKFSYELKCYKTIVNCEINLKVKRKIEDSGVALKLNEKRRDVKDTDPF